MQSLVTGARDAGLARIKLAWWRDQLEGLDTNPVPAEPRLQTAAAELLSRGIRGSELSAIEGGWSAFFDDQLDFALVMSRGSVLFQIGAKLLEATDPYLSNAGALFALGGAARMGHEPPQNLTVPLARPLRGHAVPRRLRSLTALARLAVRDIRHGEPLETLGTRRRALQVLMHLWSGRIW